MKKFKAALFDLDGVVFDTEPQYTELGMSMSLNSILTNQIWQKILKDRH